MTTHQDHSKQLPSYVDLDKWQDATFAWSGQITLDHFTRLSELVHEQHLTTPLQVSCNMSIQRQLLTLSLSFNGVVWVTCQRCLDALPITLDQQVSLALIASDEELSLLQDGDDYLMLDEVLAASQKQRQTSERLLPLQGLIEDELLLMVPLSAKHNDCDMAVDQVGTIEEAEPDNPFAQLASLKGKL